MWKIIMNLFDSATRIVLLGFAMALILANMYVVLMNPHDTNIVSKVTDLFGQMTGQVIAFYFGQKFHEATQALKEKAESDKK